MNKIIFTNSQGSWLDTNGVPYTKLISTNNLFCYIKNGLEIAEIIENFDNIFNSNQIDIVVFQLGIVETANRILNDRTKKYLSFLPVLGKVITKIIWMNKLNWLKLKRFLKLKDYQKRNEKQVFELYSKLIQNLSTINIKRIYIVNVPLMNDSYLKNENPYINDYIFKHNNKIKSLESQKVVVLDVSDLLCSDDANYTKGTVHFTKKGHELMANFLIANIKELQINENKSF